MGWLQRVREKNTEKRRDRLRGDIMAISKQNPIFFNPMLVSNITTMSEQEEFSKRVMENLVWFTGKPRAIRQFYQTNYDLVEDLMFFWQKAPINVRKLHTGIPKLISNKFGTILFGSGFDLDLQIYKVDAEGNITDKMDDALIKATNDLFTALLDKVKFIDKVKSAAATESYSGHMFAKLNYDIDLSPFPILETRDIRDCEVEKARGITKSITFKTWYNHSSNKVYVHHEIYTVSLDGDAMILNKLFEQKANGQLVEVSLTYLEETSNLVPEFVFEGIKGMLAFEKPNRLPNNEFLDCPYGASDYSGAISSFDALDEAYSILIGEIRSNKTKRYIPKTMWPKRLVGGEVISADFDDFVDNYVKVEDLMESQGDNKIDITEIRDKTTEHWEKFKAALTMAINSAGLSPLALGITGLEAINAGEQSQRERNKVTLETRTDKLNLWKPVIEEMLIRLVELNNWMRNKFPKEIKSKQKGIEDVNVDWSNMNINVVFSDYIVESQEKELIKWGGAKQQGIASIETVIDMIHPDWSDDKRKEEVNRIKFEQSMTFDNPMSLPELTGTTTDEVDDDEDNI